MKLVLKIGGNTKMPDFKVIYDRNTEKFEKKVLEFLNQGYKMVNCEKPTVEFHAYMLKD